MEMSERKRKEVVSVKLSRELASQLRKLMDVGDTYESVIRRLLERYEREREEGDADGRG